MHYLIEKSLATLRAQGPLGLVSKTARFLLLAAELQVAGFALRRKARDVGTPEEALDFSRRFRFGGVSIEPLQLGFEILQLLHLLERDPPRAVVEIGTSLGGSFFLFTRVAAPDATLISVDLPGGTYGGGYFATRGRLLRSFARARQRVELVRADSHDPKTLERTKRLLAGRAVDFLFVDGDHTYEGVRSDYEMYGALVRPGGLIAFHDIVPTTLEDVGVPAFWSELRVAHDTEEFRKPDRDAGKGIGLLRVR